jgi:transmembrane sensor
MINKEKIDILIAKSFSGSISRVENDELESWFSESKENSLYYQELKNLWQILNPAFEPDSIDINEAERKFMKQIHERKFINSNIIVWWQRVAAIIIIPLIIAVAYLSYVQLFTSSKVDVAYQEISSPPGMSSKINLPDGTVVWLNSGSKLRFPVMFASQERNVFLSGEGYFKVKSDKQHPFIVFTDKMHVTATGTQFNVEAYQTDSITAVTLIEGKVDVNIGTSIVEKLKPNQRIVLNSNSNIFTVIETEAQHWGAWKDGILAFRNEPLSDVFKRLGRTFNVDIKVKDTVAARQLYRATFQEESLDEILRLLKLSAPIRYKKVERTKQNNNYFNRQLIEVYSSR